MEIENKKSLKEIRKLKEDLDNYMETIDELNIHISSSNDELDMYKHKLHWLKKEYSKLSEQLIKDATNENNEFSESCPEPMMLGPSIIDHDKPQLDK